MFKSPEKGAPREAGIAQIFLLVILLIGLAVGYYLVNFTITKFKPKAFENENVLQVLGTNNEPTNTVDSSEINLKINLPSDWKLEGSALEAPNVLKGLYVENKDDGSNGHEKFYIEPTDPKFQDYINKPFYWKLNDLELGKDEQDRVVQLTLFNGKYYVPFPKTIKLTNKIDNVSGLKSASILDLPFRVDTYCFNFENKSKPECSNYYTDKCYANGPCDKELVCEKYYNPVIGTDGYFYPTACWAEKLGTDVASYGYSPQLVQFFKDLWRIRIMGESIDVPKPHITFDYQGNTSTERIGTYFRSNLWQNPSFYKTRDFYIEGYHQTGEKAKTMFYSENSHSTLEPVVDNEISVLVAFVLFDDSFTKDELKRLFNKYTPFINDYIAKKQQVPKPIQYKFYPVVLDPPVGFKNSLTFSDSDKEAIYELAVNKVSERQEFKLFTMVPVQKDVTGGLYSRWRGKQFIHANLGSPNKYSEIDQKDGLNALAAFNQLLLTLSHEILHAVGMSAEHMELAYVHYYNRSLQGIDYTTGKIKQEITPWCDFIGSSEEHYAVELPDSLKIRAGNEPTWLYKTVSPSGDCLGPIYNGEVLKNFNNSGEYKLVYTNNTIDPEMQKALGWVDIDGDQITELLDPDPYGDFKVTTIKKVGLANTPGPSLSFELLGEVTQSNCRFAQIRLEDGREGLTPLECAEFDDSVVNLYRGVKYNWTMIHKDYGIVLLVGS